MIITITKLAVDYTIAILSTIEKFEKKHKLKN
jgi:hypothetical protein